MSWPTIHTVSVTTNGSGAATAYTDTAVRGRIVNIIYTKTDFADGVDFTITLEDSAQNLWVDTNINASETVAPRQPTHDSAGDASLYAAAGEPVEDYIYACHERVKIVIASGGDTKSGTFKIIVA